MKRYLKILLEIVFYSWVMYFVLAFFGHETLTWAGICNRLFLRYVLSNQDGGFVPGFLWMYLMIPAMNVYHKAASRRNLYSYVGTLLTMFTICGTVLNANVYHNVFWYVTLYFVGGLIRIHPFEWMGRNKVCVSLFVGSVSVAIMSILMADIMAILYAYPVRTGYYFVADSHKIFAFMVALFAFLVFRNWHFPQSRFVNSVASTTFGVLLIHAATDGMRKWLWQDFVNVPAAYTMPFLGLVGYSVIVVFCVFVVCSALDYVRIRFLERPVFNLFP